MKKSVVLMVAVLAMACGAVAKDANVYLLPTGGAALMATGTTYTVVSVDGLRLEGDFAVEVQHIGGAGSISNVSFDVSNDGVVWHSVANVASTNNYAGGTVAVPVGETYDKVLPLALSVRLGSEVTGVVTGAVVLVTR